MTSYRSDMQMLRRSMPAAESHRRKSLRAAALAEQDGKCIYCHAELTLGTATLEHIAPKSKGGDDHPSNVAASCQPCNSERGNKNHAAFLRYKQKASRP